MITRTDGRRESEACDRARPIFTDEVEMGRAGEIDIGDPRKMCWRMGKVPGQRVVEGTRSGGCTLGIIAYWGDCNLERVRVRYVSATTTTTC